MASQNTPGALPNPYAYITQATVASAPPVKYTEEQAKAQQQKKAPASRFHNPHTIKRPQAKKSGPTIKKPLMPAISTSASASAPATTGTQQHGIDYYRSTVDDDAAILEERRQRQYEERQRKKDLKKFHKQYGYWNPTAPHKPERYSNLKAYRASGGYTRKKDDFKNFLRQAAEKSKSREEASDTSNSRPVSSSSSQPPAATAAKLSFAPPASYDTPTGGVDERSAQDAYRLTQERGVAPPPPPPPADSAVPPPPPPPPSVVSASQATYYGATISAPPVRYANATISAPPVRFERPDVEMGDVGVGEEPYEDEARPAKRSKIGKSKAEAMMFRMGYVKGQGLGKNNDGVLTHLEVKRRKVPQGANMLNDDNTKVPSQQVWDVHGGLRSQKDEPNKFGQESNIVVAWGCTDGIDWHENAQRDDGGIRQEMGEAFAAKFGPVQQIQLDEANKEGAVYIKFESVMSALNAVNRFEEGFTFRGKTIRARFYDEKKFHASVWDH